MGFINPIVIKEHSVRNIKEMVHASLKELGCSEDKLSYFDGFSTISINIENLPAINISISNERLWIWSLLSDLDSECVMNNCAKIVFLLQEKIPYVETGQLVLGYGENGFELKALVDPSCLENKCNLISVLESFFYCLDGLVRDVLHR
ncbi:InvB/SpaK family type III secretion system chaperone [Dongshaea marina]|uniref:InvB/SpaK family type III secretion system chaperone n=1 Tax=Dongshaea marina TaxID=2047966 RepID=UPI000D3E400D|nr:hypothetical protein [Dongshaea marina]